MNILHYLNVVIGFSMVMLLLSIVTSFLAQTWLYFIKAKSRAVGNGLAGLLRDVGIDKDLAKVSVNALLNREESLLGKNMGGFLNKLSSIFLAGAPKEIGREEFLLLILRKAKTDANLANALNFAGVAEAAAKLTEVESAMLKYEAEQPNLPAQVWRTKAIQETVSNLASGIFARFDEVMDRVADETTAFGKLLGIVITLPILLIFWPVDSIDLLDRLSKDPVVAEKLADVAADNLAKLQASQDELQKCLDKKDTSDNCEELKTQTADISKGILREADRVSGLFGDNLDKSKTIECEYLFKGCTRSPLTSGLFVTWILVSLGSAFWLGVLNKMLGIRSEFGKKLAAQRDYRASSQESRSE